jgi:hypothetical protein
MNYFCVEIDPVTDEVGNLLDCKAREEGKSGVSQVALLLDELDLS